MAIPLHRPYHSGMTIDELDRDPMVLSYRTAVEQVVNWYEQLTPKTLAQVEAVYSPTARFKDPFNDVRGVHAIRAVFTHMFARLDAPRFVVRRRLVDGAHAMLVWDFTFRFRGETQERCIHGATHLHFAPDGRILLHRDYWDAAEELYEKLPVLGSLMRWLKRRASR